MTIFTSQILRAAIRRTGSFLFVVALIFPALCLAQRKRPVEVQIQKCWEHRYEGTGDSMLAADNTSIFMVRDGSVIEAVSAESGKLVWSSDVGGSVDSNLLVAAGNVFLVRRPVAGGTDKAETAVVRALSTTTGITKWSASFAGGDGSTLGTIGDAVIAISQNGIMQSFALTNGATRWKRQLPVEVGIAPIFSGGKVYLVGDGTLINSVEGTGGEPAPVAKAPFAVSTIADPQENTLVWGDERGNLTSYNLIAGRIEWQFKSGARISRIIRLAGLLVAASNDNFVYAIAPGSGNRVWKKRVLGRIQSIQAVNENSLLIQTVGEHNVLFLNVKSGKTEGQIVFKDDEFPVASTVTDDSKSAILTDRALYLYAHGGCSPKKESGP